MIKFFINLGGHFAPAWGGHVKPAEGGHFAPAGVVTLLRFQVVTLTDFSNQSRTKVYGRRKPNQTQDFYQQPFQQKRFRSNS